ncbi:MAG TPA: hypothetical protein PKY77_05805 [Phycisphaerae bacterium]|nr:hypothetical protein [Phycisphaerae bacterium]HRY69041.1 hypothetical protein [Phycisphaerae bacterium]HSA25984.1 hypothetical protein [Phycisphaerae bacterium]
MAGWLETARKLLGRITRSESRLLAAENRIKRIDRLLAQMMANRSARAVVPGTFNAPIGDLLVAKITGSAGGHTYYGRIQYCTGYGTFENDDVWTDTINVSPLPNADSTYPELTTGQYVFVRSQGRTDDSEYWIAISGVGSSVASSHDPWWGVITSCTFGGRVMVKKVSGTFNDPPGVPEEDFTIDQGAVEIEAWQGDGWHIVGDYVHLIYNGDDISPAWSVEQRIEGTRAWSVSQSADWSTNQVDPGEVTSCG